MARPGPSRAQQLPSHHAELRAQVQPAKYRCHGPLWRYSGGQSWTDSRPWDKLGPKGFKKDQWEVMLLSALSSEAIACSSWVYGDGFRCTLVQVLAWEDAIGCYCVEKSNLPTSVVPDRLQQSEYEL